MESRSAFFTQPDYRPMRQYEALRAFLHEGCSIEEAAQRGGYTPGSFRNLLTRFRKTPSPFFFWPQPESSGAAVKPPDPRPAQILALRTEQGLTIYEIQDALKKQKMPASLGYIHGIFQKENLPRLPRRAARAPRTVTAASWI